MAAGGWHRHEIRVRYQETDQMGVVYHANYLNWFELGRTELVRSLGMTYRELEGRGLLLPVLELEIKYRSPARYDDRIAILTRVADFSGLRMAFESEIRRIPEDSPTGDEFRVEAERSGQHPGLEHPLPAAELLVSGTTRHAWVNREWKPARIDREAPDLFRLLKEHRPKEGK